MLPPYSAIKRLTAFPIILFVLAASPQISRSEQLELLLEGTGDSGITDYALLIIVMDNLAKIAIRGEGCFGEMDAKFSRIDRYSWQLSAIGDGAPCEVLLLEGKSGLIETIQGPGCSYYHGAACGFSGKFGAPTSGGLAPFFDPAL